MDDVGKTGITIFFRALGLVSLYLMVLFLRSISSGEKGNKYINIIAAIVSAIIGAFLVFADVNTIIKHW